MQRSVRNVCAKFKVDRLRFFQTGARQVFTTHKSLASNFYHSQIFRVKCLPLSNLSRQVFIIHKSFASSVYHSQIFRIKCLPLTNLSRQVFTTYKSFASSVYHSQIFRFLDSIRVFSFFSFIFHLNKRNKKSTVKESHKKSMLKS